MVGIRYCSRLPSYSYQLHRFKLHLRPPSLNDKDPLSREQLCPLPSRKTIEQVFGDFLSYLFKCAKQFITETHANGPNLWDSFENRIDFVLSHPNRWEGLQQTRMRNAAVLGGLIPNTHLGQSRIHFVSEGEASLHYSLDDRLAAVDITKVSHVLSNQNDDQRCLICQRAIRW